MCPDGRVWMCFVKVNGPFVWGALRKRRIKKRNRTAEEARSHSPLFVKGLLHWLGLWGRLAPLSGQIHPCVLLLEEGGCLKWEIQSHVHQFLAHRISAWFVFFSFNHLYLTLLSFTVCSSVFRIKATAPWTVTLSRHVTLLILWTVYKDFTGLAKRPTGHVRFATFKARHQASTLAKTILFSLGTKRAAYGQALNVFSSRGSMQVIL